MHKETDFLVNRLNFDPVVYKGCTEKEIMLVGLIDHFEIWSLEKWEIENQRIVQALNSGDFKDELADLGI